jgi:hypothetical protein
VACAWVAGIPLAALWVALTALEGRTYRLAPLLAAAAPGVAARILGVRAEVVVRSVVVAGLLTAAIAWGVIEVLGIVPSAMLWDGQPGGVRAEVAAVAVAGALGGMFAARPPKISRSLS